MLHSVNVLRHRKNGTYVLNPLGTFAGHGGLIGIYPYRDLYDPSNEELGKLVIELLLLSGPTGYPIRDIESYRLETLDNETERVRNSFFPPGRRRNTSSLAREFLHGGVKFESGQKSWLVESRVFDSEDHDLKIYKQHRVPTKLGPSLLGAAIAEFLMDAALHGKR